MRIIEKIRLIFAKDCYSGLIFPWGLISAISAIYETRWTGRVQSWNTQRTPAIGRIPAGRSLPAST